VAGSGRRGGVPVEGGSGGVAVASGAVLWLEVEVRGEAAGAMSEREEKHGAGRGREKSGRQWAAAPF
jgi:hypothetical protein